MKQSLDNSPPQIKRNLYRSTVWLSPVSRLNAAAFRKLPRGAYVTTDPAMELKAPCKTGRLGCNGEAPSVERLTGLGGRSCDLSTTVLLAPHLGSMEPMIWGASLALSNCVERECKPDSAKREAKPPAAFILRKLPLFRLY